MIRISKPILHSPRNSLELDREVEVGQLTESKTDDRLRCRAGSCLITRGHWAVNKGGAVEHRFRNPAGWSFQVACYLKAPGALADGGLTTEYTWFAGYRWCFAICSKCGTHLGWWYVGPDTFAGLIVTRLR